MSNPSSKTLNNKEAQRFLSENGPWQIEIDSPEFKFKNANGDVLTAELYVETFMSSSGYIEANYTLETKDAPKDNA